MKPYLNLASGKKEKERIAHTAWFDTPLGTMFAISDAAALYFLAFVETRRDLARDIEKFKRKTKVTLVSGDAKPLVSIRKELQHYFAGLLTEFKTPLHLQGSAFQKQAWEALLQIPYGTTRSYQQQAEMVGKRTAYRAVANANGANQIAVVVPCHRIINTNGGIGGYGGGIARKRWLLEHEKKYSQFIK